MVAPVAISFTFNGDTGASSYVNSAQLDTQLANLAATVNAEITERQRTIRDGSGLAQQVVTYDSLHPRVTALLVAGGVIPKQAVSTIGLSNITLSGLQTIDGYTLLTNDRILLTAQSNQLDNGIWAASSGSWTRPLDSATGAVLAIYTQVSILAGNSFNGAFWILSVAATVGTTAQTWVIFANAAYVTVSTPQTVVGAKTFSGILTASNTAEATAPSAAGQVTLGGHGVVLRSFLGTIGSTFRGNVLAGVQDGTTAVTGQVGQYIESKPGTATNAAATGVYLAFTSITLSAGDWLISAVANTEPGSGATTTVGGALEALIGTTTASSTGATRGYDWVKSSHALALLDCAALVIPTKRVNISASTTYYLNVMQTYTAGTPQWRGALSATRMR